MLLSDDSRRDVRDGTGIRLPTICLRPGKPNLAASGFFSGILREPLSGREAVLPVGEDIEALRRVAGERGMKLIRREPDPTIARIVAGWPQHFDARRAETSFDEIVRAHVEHDLGGVVGR